MNIMFGCLPKMCYLCIGYAGNRWPDMPTVEIGQMKKTITNKTHLSIMENNNQPQQEQQGLSLEIAPEVAKGEYANLALITHSSSDFILDFACVLPGMPKAQVCSRVIMAPEHVKRLLQALQGNIYKYEQTFGKIQIPNQPEDRTIAPFNAGKGEA